MSFHGPATGAPTRRRGLIASRVLAVTTAIIVLVAWAAGRPAVAETSGAAVEQKIEALLRQMTLEEKIGQMTQFAGEWDVTGSTVRASYLDDIRKGHVGSVLNAYTPEFTRKLQKVAVEETRLHIPLLFGYDVIHGHRTIFPIPLAEACSWDLAVMERSARIAATEAAADGLHWTFAPMVDVARDPRWGRIAEGAGEDPYLGSLIAAARVRGFQGVNLAAVDAVLACVKHYAAYGAPQAGRDYSTVDMSTRELLGVYMPPYLAAVQAGAATVMTSFNEIDGVPSTGSSYLLDEILKKKWGFRGFVVTDYTAINEMVNHGIVGDNKDAAALAANAGVDMDMQGATFLNHMKALVSEGRVPMARVDDAVRRILRIKFARGLFDDPYLACNPERAKATLMRPDFLEASRDAARRSIVLLKNANGVLPLRKSGITIALVGPLADNRAEMLGTWAAAGDGKKCLSVKDGMAGSGYSVKVLTARGCAISGDDRSGFDAAVAVARQSDVVVAVMGESLEMSGEAASRAHIDLPGVQRELLARLKSAGKPVILVVMNGRPLDLSWESQHMDAVVEAWFLGTRAGPAVADVLFGDYNPSGRLVTSFPRTLGQVPIFYASKPTGRPFDAKNKYSTKYLDVSNEPLYPFGYGLSYTTFGYSPLTLDRERMGPTDTLTVKVTVTNTGNRDGEEVVQLYLRDLVGSVTRPVKELKGFQKVAIPKGQSRTLTFTLTAKDLAFYRRDMTHGAEAGQFRVWVGPNAASGSTATFHLTESVAVPDV